MEEEGDAKCWKQGCGVVGVGTEAGVVIIFIETLEAISLGYTP